jgi:Zn-dependent protease with chaperone function
MSDAVAPQGRFDRLYLRLGRRFGESLLNEVTTDRSLRPRLTVSKVLAFGFAAIVHALTLVVATLSVVLIVRGWPNVILVAAGVLSLGVAWLLRPRIPKLRDEVLPRERFPTLYALVDRIAEALGAPPIDGIVATSEFNAAYGQFGLKRRRIVFIGLPYFLICDPCERTSLLAHELAHGVNGDPNRGFFMGSAIRSLVVWRYLLHPGGIVSQEGGCIGLCMIPINLAIIGVCQILWAAIYVLIHLIWRDSQRAEYLADYLAATAAGTEAGMSLLRTARFHDEWETIVQRVSLGGTDASLFEEFVQRVKQARDDKDPKIAQSSDDVVRLDATHPPAPHRIQFLRSREVLQPRVELSRAESEAIDGELLPLHASIRRQIIDAHRRSLEMAYY